MVIKKSYLLLLIVLCVNFIISAQSVNPSFDGGGGIDTSQAEVIRRQARQLGISPQEYLKLKYSKSTTLSTKKDTEEEQVPGTFSVPVNKPLASYEVDAFKNRTIADTLPAFGYKIFSTSPTSFQPGLNLPVPENYVVGPGDEIIITMWGETQLQQNLTVNKEGNIYIPNVGLVNVNGMSLSGLKTKLKTILSKTYSSLNVTAQGRPQTYLNVSTGTLRSVKVYVLGEVNRPGGYTLPSLSTSFTALYYSGGPTINGSLRDIRVIRNGHVISDIDFYNYLINGDKSKDIRLEDEDIVYVPPVGKRVAISGAVFRPAIYEMKGNENLSDLLKYCGGVTINAYFQTVHVERIVPFNERDKYKNDILNLDLNFSSVNKLRSSGFILNDGDAVHIPAINNLPENKLVITGSVRKPGTYELEDSTMTVKQLISKAGSVLPDAFMDKAMIIRTLLSGKKEVLSFNVKKAFEGDPVNNLRLKNRDQVTIYNEQDIFPAKTVEINGAVRKPGTYKRYNGMTLTDLIVLAGGLTDSAMTSNIEVARMDSTSPDIYAHKQIVSLPKDYWGVSRSKDYLLNDYDRVLVKTDPNKNYSRSIFVAGEVKYPGRYALLYNNEKIYDVIRRAGGFKASAYTQGLSVIRHNRLFSTLKSQIIPDTILSKIKDIPIYNKTVLQDEFSNRIPIPWQDIKEDTSSIYNIKMEPGDSVVVPKNPNVVYVLGEVGLPSYVPYKNGAGLGYYINQAGGYTENSDKGHEIVMLPNGKKWEPSGWFFIPNPEILSGSTIIVPSYIESESNFWPTVRDAAAFVTSTAVLILTVKALSK